MIGGVGVKLPHPPSLFSMVIIRGGKHLKLFTKKLVPYFFILPTFVFLLVFFYYAIYFIITSSFKEFTLGYTSTFIGVNNFKQLFNDIVFLRSLVNQAVITAAALIFNISFPLMAAEFLYFLRRKHIAEGIKKAFVIPMLVPGLVTILIWKFMYNPNFGINSILDVLGMKGFQHDWLNESGISLLAIIFVGFPFVAGFYFLVFHSAINTIPKEIHESAMLDGCRSTEIFWYLHLPNILPYINVVSILTIINSLQAYGSVLALTKGGPGYDSMIPALYMWKIGIGDQNMGYSSSMAVILFLIVMMFTVISQKITKSK